MTTTIELTSSAVRLCRFDDQRLVQLESWPVAEGQDPIAVLRAAPLPPELGKVRVVLAHDELLLRTMVQPPCPLDRLDRIVRFDLEAAGGEADPIAIAWHRVKAGLGDDFRILALVTKRKLIAQINEALAVHGAKAAAVTAPPLGLWHALRQQESTLTDPVAVVDVGGARIHLCLVQDGELLFLRSVTPGLEELVKQVAELRSLATTDARPMIAKLGSRTPADLQELIDRQAGLVATAISNNLRFAKAQLHLDRFEPKYLYLAGAGAQAPGFVAALAARSGIPVRILNPFAGVLSSLPAADLDRVAALPSAWTTTLGVAQAKDLELDACTEERLARSRFWATTGILRIAAVLAVTLIFLALVRQQVTQRQVDAALDTKDATSLAALVDAAKKADQSIAGLRIQREESASLLRWLDGERRPGRIAPELLAAFAAEIDPATRPVVLKRFRVARIPGATEIELEGSASAVPGGAQADTVFKDFAARLKARYPVVTTETSRSVNVGHEGNALPFSAVFTIADPG